MSQFYKEFAKFRNFSKSGKVEGIKFFYEEGIFPPSLLKGELSRFSS